jgi:hypothetical protein
MRWMFAGPLAGKQQHVLSMTFHRSFKRQQPGNLIT